MDKFVEWMKQSGKVDIKFKDLSQKKKDKIINSFCINHELPFHPYEYPEKVFNEIMDILKS